MSYFYNPPASGMYGDPWLRELALQPASSERASSNLDVFGIPGATSQIGDAYPPIQVVSADGPTGDAAMDAARTLARMIFAEGAESYREPDTLEALGWVPLNRLGAPGFAQRFDRLFSRRQFNAVGNPLWRRAANPSSLEGDNAEAYKRALEVAKGILDGRISDPTGGAQFFYSGPTAPAGFFTDGINSGRLVPVGPADRSFTFLRDTQPPQRRR